MEIQAANANPNSETSLAVQQFLATQVDGIFRQLMSRRTDDQESYVQELARTLGEGLSSSVKGQLTDKEFYEDIVDSIRYAYQTNPDGLGVIRNGMNLSVGFKPRSPEELASLLQLEEERKLAKQRQRDLDRDARDMDLL